MFRMANSPDLTIDIKQEIKQKIKMLDHYCINIIDENIALSGHCEYSFCFKFQL